MLFCCVYQELSIAKCSFTKRDFTLLADIVNYYVNTTCTMYVEISLNLLLFQKRYAVRQCKFKAQHQDAIQYLSNYYCRRRCRRRHCRHHHHYHYNHLLFLRRTKFCVLMLSVFHLSNINCKTCALLPRFCYLTNNISFMTYVHMSIPNFKWLPTFVL